MSGQGNQSQYTVVEMMCDRAVRKTSIGQDKTRVAFCYQKRSVVL